MLGDRLFGGLSAHVPISSKAALSGCKYQNANFSSWMALPWLKAERKIKVVLFAELLLEPPNVGAIQRPVGDLRQLKHPWRSVRRGVTTDEPMLNRRPTGTRAGPIP